MPGRQDYVHIGRAMARAWSCADPEPAPFSFLRTGCGIWATAIMCSPLPELVSCPRCRRYAARAYRAEAALLLDVTGGPVSVHASRSLALAIAFEQPGG